MNFVAFRMLTGDPAKYLGLIFAIAFSTLLMTHQASIFCGLMNRTRSQILDVQDAAIWVMDRKTQYFDEVKALTDQDLYRIRGVPGVAWAVPLYKGTTRAKAFDGDFRAVILLGHDDATLIGAPRSFAMGSIEALRQPDAVLVDRTAWKFFFGDMPYNLNQTLEMNDRTVRIVGVVNSSAPFTNLPVVYTRYTQALQYVGRERNLLSFVLAAPKAGVPAPEATRRITEATGLKALSSSEFGWETIWYTIRNTGIPINFGITIVIAIIVGTVVSGQTFYIFTIENLKQFGALKAIGVTDLRLVGMILLQSMLVAAIGYSLGIGGTALFFDVTKDNLDLRGFTLLPEIAIGGAVLIFFIAVLASVISVRRVVVLEPAIVFRG